MEFLPISDSALTRAAAVLRDGGLVAFPTETVYGLGGDAFNAGALAKIFAAKGRPRFDPLIVHISSIETLEKIADLSLLNGSAKKSLGLLAENLWPGPLTLILPKLKTVPDIATSGLPTVAVRFPDHPVAQKLIALSSGALAAPSANPFGYLSPTRAEHVRDQLGDKVDIILDGGPSKLGLESTVLDICGPLPRILRPGAAPKEAIEALIGPSQAYSPGLAAVRDNAAGDGETPAGLVSPGQLKSHYAPRTPLSVYSLEDLPRENDDDGKAAVLFFDGPSRDAWLVRRQGGGTATLRVLSETGDPLAAAACLFETLHELDRSGFSRIFAQLVPEEGLGEAINDRLRRAGSIFKEI
ncbi:MAG: threonylcarbamoyl-AMP synthase [Treponema sp.]|jgi:L-threonylcarbamoyladenylate synthase|nr:threonylcarbamoyl-AMP synthase [Treponema sp.]